MAIYDHRKNALQNLREQELHAKKMQLIQLQIDRESGRRPTVQRNDSGATHIQNLDDFRPIY